MAIKYYSAPGNKTIAVLDGTRYDAINKIVKLTGESDVCLFCDKYMMPDTFRVETRCHEGDVFNEEIGRKIAKAKLMKKYYKCFDRKMAMFKVSMDRLNNRVDDFFNDKT